MKRGAKVVLGLAVAASIAALGWMVQGHAAMPPVPEGWRLPSQAELGDDWRAASPTRAAAADGDVDGDGKTDFARLLVRSDNRAEALVVWLSSRGEWVVVDRLVAAENKAALDKVFMGLEPIPAGAQRLYCGSEMMCPRQNRARWTAPRAALDYHRPGSTSAIVFFEPSRREFVRLWYTE